MTSGNAAGACPAAAHKPHALLYMWPACVSSVRPECHRMRMPGRHACTAQEQRQCRAGGIGCKVHSPLDSPWNRAGFCIRFRACLCKIEIAPTCPCAHQPEREGYAKCLKTLPNNPPSHLAVFPVFDAKMPDSDRLVITAAKPLPRSPLHGGRALSCFLAAPAFEPSSFPMLAAQTNYCTRS